MLQLYEDGCSIYFAGSIWNLCIDDNDQQENLRKYLSSTNEEAASRFQLFIFPSDIDEFYKMINEKKRKGDSFLQT